MRNISSYNRYKDKSHIEQERTLSMHKIITAKLVKRQYNNLTNTTRWLFCDKQRTYYEWYCTQPRFFRIGETYSFKACIEASHQHHASETFIIKNVHNTKVVPEKSLRPKVDYHYAFDAL